MRGNKQGQQSSAESTNEIALRGFRSRLAGVIEKGLAPSGVIGFGIGFALGFVSAWVLGPVAASQFLMSAVVGGFIGAMVQITLGLARPKVEDYVRHLGKFRYAPAYLEWALNSQKQVVIFAGDLDWIEDTAYHQAMGALRQRGGRGVIMLCWDPETYGGVKKGLVEKRVEILRTDYDVYCLAYHSGDFRGLVCEDTYAEKQREPASFLERVGLGVPARARQDYLVYHSAPALAESLRSILGDYAAFGRNAQSAINQSRWVR